MPTTRIRWPWRGKCSSASCGRTCGGRAQRVRHVAQGGWEMGQAPVGVDSKKGLRLQFNNSRQSSTVDTSMPFSARHFEYSTEYSTYIPCR
eukprot:1189753-Prorocentrum_minimum.AAC.1